MLFQCYNCKIKSLCLVPLHGRHLCLVAYLFNSLLMLWWQKRNTIPIYMYLKACPYYYVTIIATLVSTMKCLFDSLNNFPQLICFINWITRSMLLKLGNVIGYCGDQYLYITVNQVTVYHCCLCEAGDIFDFDSSLFWSEYFIFNFNWQNQLISINLLSLVRTLNCAN